MRNYLIILLIGLVAGFIGIIPLMKAKADKYLTFAVFVLYLMMPYAVYHISVPGIPWWLKGSVVTLALSIPLMIAAGKGYKRCIVPMLLMSVAVGAFITFLGHYLL